MYLNEKQVAFLKWLYNFSISQMAAQPHKFKDSDQKQLLEATKRNFPEYADQITKIFTREDFES